MNQSISQLMNSVKNGVIEPIYLFQGTDKYLQRFLSDKIASEYFKNNKSDKSLLIPDDMKGLEIIEQITATDLFSNKKMFILYIQHKYLTLIRHICNYLLLMML